MFKHKFKTEYSIILIFVLINLAVHLVADLNSFYHGDELLHINAGRYPAMGYMDFAPLIAYLAYFQNLFQSDALVINHLTVHIASALILVLCGLITIRLGGKWLAVLVTLLCIVLSPGFGASHSLFLPAVFEQLAWVACLYFMVAYCDAKRAKSLIFLGICAGFGFLTKYSILFLLAGLVVATLLFQRELLKQKSLWVCLLLFILLIAPNIQWQISKGLPVLNHMSKLYETQLDNTSRMAELKTMLLFLNPFTALFWLTGLFIVPFLDAYKKYRVPLFALLFSFLLLFVAKGKTYYYFPLILCVLPFGAAAAENILMRRKILATAYISLLVVFGLAFLPMVIPFLPLRTYISIYHPAHKNNGRTPLMFENYYSRDPWQEVLTTVDSTYRNLPVAERKDCLIWGRHYSQAGGINLLGKKYGLPQAISFHSSFYNWVPGFSSHISMIVISDVSWDKEHWLRYFDDVQEVKIIENQYASDKEWAFQHVFLCRNLKYSSEELKRKFLTQVF